MKSIVRYTILLLLLVMGKTMVAQFDAVEVDITIHNCPSEKYNLVTYYKFFESKYILRYSEYRVRNSEFVFVNGIEIELSKEVFNKIAERAIGVSSCEFLLGIDTDNIVIIDDCECLIDMNVSVVMKRSVRYSTECPFGKQYIQKQSAPYQIQCVIQEMLSLIGIDYKEVLSGYYESIE